MKRVVVLGAGVSGLLAAYTLKKYENVKVTILEPEKIGGEFLTGGMKYIHRTDEVVSMFVDLGLAFSNYMVKGGILLKEIVEPYPKIFKRMTSKQAVRVQTDHYKKTRRTEPGVDVKKAMNDPAAGKPRAALRTPFDDMVEMLAKSVASKGTFYRCGAIAISTNRVFTTTGMSIPYDYLITTLPLWVFREIAPWKTPHGLAMNLNVVDTIPNRDRYSKWDYVYTPYTPAGAVHRISQNEEGYSVEVNGKIDEIKLGEDLNFIFKGGWHIRRIQTGLKGHLLPLEEAVDWPDNVAPLGRFAKWESRITMDVTMQDAIELGEKWFR